MVGPGDGSPRRFPAAALRPGPGQGTGGNPEKAGAAGVKGGDRMQTMRQDAETILRSAIQAVLPDEAVRRALSGRVFPGKVYLVAAGKAAYRMAAAAAEMVPGLAE